MLVFVLEAKLAPHCLLCSLEECSTYFFYFFFFFAPPWEPALCNTKIMARLGPARPDYTFEMQSSDAKTAPR